MWRIILIVMMSFSHIVVVLLFPFVFLLYVRAVPVSSVVYRTRSISSFVSVPLY